MPYFPLWIHSRANRKEGQYLADHQDSLVLLRRFHHAVRRFEFDGNRLFDQHVFAGSERFQRHRFVHFGRQADIDEIDFRVRQQLMVILKAANSFQIDLSGRRTKIPLNAAPITGQPFDIPGGDGGNFPAAQSLRTLEMGVAHESYADDPDLHHPASPSNSHAVMPLRLELNGPPIDGCQLA